MEPARQRFAERVGANAVDMNNEARDSPYHFPPILNSRNSPQFYDSGTRQPVMQKLTFTVE
jgi:hypothetical protein